MYIQEVRRLLDLCNLDCNVDKDKLIRNSIIARINSTKANQQCILKGSNLSLEDCIKICQMEDATHRQVQALHPESSDCSDSTQSTRSQTSLSTSEAGEATAATEAEVGPTGVGDPSRATGPDPGKTTSTVQPLCVNTVGEPHTTLGKSAGP